MVSVAQHIKKVRTKMKSPFDHADDARAVLESLRWKPDTVIVNHFQEKVWLKQMPGYITDCCPFESPCARHQAMNLD